MKRDPTPEELLVAEALARRQFAPPAQISPPATHAAYDAHVKAMASSPYFLDLARAAFGAMREPTAEMREKCWYLNGTTEVWKAMIDAAFPPVEE